MIPKAEAIKSLDNDAQFSIQHLADGDVITWYTAPINDEKIDTELFRLQTEYNTQEYARNRTTAYPSIGDQLDYIYHNGVAKWKTDMIDPVKTKYPKG